MPFDDPFSDFDPRVYGFVARVARRVGRWYFRFELRGLEHLPDGPCLVVGNHSGLGIVEELLLLGAWEARFGLERRAWGLVHDFFWEAPISSSYYRRIGAVPASRENAFEAFARGDVVLVFPGGDYESCRPFHQARIVDFGGRRGYAEVARDANLPIIPLATTGSHWTWTFLPGGKLLAALPGLRRLGMERVPLPTAVLGLVLVIAAVLTEQLAMWWMIPATLLAMLPTPVRVTSTMLPPINASGDVDAVDARVRNAIGAALRSHTGVQG